MRALWRIAVVFVIGVAVASLLASIPTGNSFTGIATRPGAGSLPDTATLQSFRAYWSQHVADIKRPLVATDTGYPLMTSAQAQAAVFTSPTIDWLYDSTRVTSAAPDPWLGLVPPGQHEFVFDVVLAGRPVAAMKIWDMPRYWCAIVRSSPSLRSGWPATSAPTTSSSPSSKTEVCGGWAGEEAP